MEAPGPASETEDATRERLRVTDERSGAAEPAPAPAPAAAAPAAGAAGGPFGGEPRDDDAAFFERLDAAPPAPAAVEYPAASNAFFENAETAPEAPEAEKNAFSEYPPRPQTTHEYPAPQQYQQSQRPASYSAALGGAQPYSQPAAAAFYDPGAGATAASQQGSQYGGGSQQGSQYGGGSQQGSVPASPAWGATAAAPAFFNPNATAQAQAQAYPAAAQAQAYPAAASRAPFQQQQQPPQWGGSGTEDSAAQWGYAQQQQWHAGM